MGVGMKEVGADKMNQRILLGMVGGGRRIS